MALSPRTRKSLLSNAVRSRSYRNDHNRATKEMSLMHSLIPHRIDRLLLT